MSILKTLSTPLTLITSVAQNLDSTLVDSICAKLASRLNIDEDVFAEKFKEHLYIFEAPNIADVKKREKEEQKAKEKEEKEKQKAKEKEEKEKQKEIEKAKKEEQKRREKEEKEKQKEIEKAKKLAEKEKLKKEKEEQKRRDKAEKDAKKETKSKTKTKEEPVEPVVEPVEEEFDFENEKPRDPSDEKFWNSKPIIIKGEKYLLSKSTNLVFCAADNESGFELFGRKKKDKSALILESSLDESIKKWVHSCGIVVPSYKPVEDVEDVEEVESEDDKDDDKDDEKDAKSDLESDDDKDEEEDDKDEDLDLNLDDIEIE